MALVAAALAGTGTARAADDEGAVPILAGYDHGFFLKSADDLFELGIGGRVQGRYTYESVDEGDDRKSESAFAVQRARLELEGHAFTPDLTFKFQADWGKGDETLKDYYVDYRFTDGVRGRIGQFKEPYSRQQLNSSGRLQFVDRSLPAEELADSRDVGIMLHDGLGKAKGFEWGVGLFNGTGDKAQFSGKVSVDPETGQGVVTSGKFSNVPDRLGPLAVARIGFNDGVIKDYSEADLEGGPLRWAVGGGLGVAFDREGPEETAVLVTVDGVVKVEGLSLSSGLFLLAEEPDGPGKNLFDQDLAATGFYVQGGYVLADRFEPALRYAMLAPKGSDNDTHEVTGAFSVYFYGHSVKWQTDLTGVFRQEPDGDRSDVVVRSQVQLAF